MLFPSKNIIYHKSLRKKVNKERKETDLHQALPLPSYYYVRKERASVFASGSITVEASFAIWIFFLAAICLVYLLEIMAVQTAVKNGLHYAGKNLAQEMYVLPTVQPSRLEEDMVAGIGADRLERSVIVGGSSGLHLEESNASPITAIANLVVTYDISLPIPIFGIEGIPYRQELRVKGWTGYVKSGIGTESEETVYVTENGLVYHKNYHCTHLDLSIQPMDMESVGEQRNEGGGKYHPCEKCGKKTESGMVYITNTGDRYHGSLGCSGLKRTVYAVPKSEAIGKGGCSRCAE